MPSDVGADAGAGGDVVSDRYDALKLDAYMLLSDLDRCMHGRHAKDTCFNCPGGWSAGNPHMRPGQVVGYDYCGRPYRVPSSGLYDRGKWLEEVSEDGAGAVRQVPEQGSSASG